MATRGETGHFCRLKMLLQLFLLSLMTYHASALSRDDDPLPSRASYWRDSAGSSNLNMLKENNPLSLRAKNGMQNLDWYRHAKKEPNSLFVPGTPAAPFTVPTLAGTLTYPGALINHTTPVLLHAYNPHSAFLQCIWNCSGSIEDFLKTSPANAHYLFLSQSATAAQDAQWMRNRFQEKAKNMAKLNDDVKGLATLPNLHFVTLPAYELGNWLSQLFKDWSCADHNCGLDQIRVVAQNQADVFRESIHVIGRLDARYDWLPSPQSTFGNKSLPAADGGDGCQKMESVKGKLALVKDGACSYYSKVSIMQQSGAVGVIVLASPGRGVQDMNCVGQECSMPLSIPASMVEASPWLESSQNRKSVANLSISFQNTPSDNFFAALDGAGNLAETGWMLYPSLQFLAWQAQWFNYKTALDVHLSEEALVVPVLNKTVMHGTPGAVGTAVLPPMSELQTYSTFELDLALSCPGDRDKNCAAWDHTVNLYVCCDKSSALCGMELGRWITPFRRRIGRWITDVSPLLPLLTTSHCNLTLTTVAWAMPWVASLNLRFSGKHSSSDAGFLYPSSVLPMYVMGSVTFNKQYNSKFSPVSIELLHECKKVELFAVITGHGSDENGCGEFCVTSHHFKVNGFMANKTFSNAGTPLGCAEQVPHGVEPNEHGTWLYGRDGWCDGQEVSPWVIDITSHINAPGQTNALTYFGWFNGTDPDPKQNPGVMIMYSYVVFYKSL